MWKYPKAKTYFLVNLIYELHVYHTRLACNLDITPMIYLHTTKFPAGMHRFGLCYCTVLGGGSVVVVWNTSLCLWKFCVCLCFVIHYLLCVHSSFAIVLKRERKLVALLLLSNRCFATCTVNVLWLFLTVPFVMMCVIAVFPDHTHLLVILSIFHPFFRFTVKKI